MTSEKIMKADGSVALPPGMSHETPKPKASTHLRLGRNATQDVVAKIAAIWYADNRSSILSLWLVSQDMTVKDAIKSYFGTRGLREPERDLLVMIESLIERDLND